MSESTDVKTRWYRRHPRLVLGLIVGAAFAVVMASVEFLTARGQLAFGAYYLHLHGWERIATYSAVQGSLLATAGLAAWAVLVGDRYFMHRIWTGVLLLGSAGVAYMGAKAAHWPTAGAISTAALAVVALRTWHAILKRVAQIVRGATVRRYMLAYPMVRWLLAFRETRSAFRLVILDNLTPDLALAAVRGQVAPVVEVEGGAPVDLSKLSKADQVRAAFRELGSYDAAPALEWLGKRGLKVDRSYVYELGRKETAARRSEIHAITSTGADQKAS